MLFAGAVTASTNAVIVAEEVADESGLRFDFGADLRVRQEIMHNVPGLPGAPGAMMPKPYREAQNHIRIRPRIWGRLDYEEFGLYARLADEIREHVVKNGTPRKYRLYNFPDEVVLDSLYLEGKGLYDGFIDFRIGRQDLFDGRHSVLGLDHIMLDGVPYVGSRSCYADMIRVTFHTSEKSNLDTFVLYNNGRNQLSYGTCHSRGRPVNAIHPGDSPGMDEWGGGAVWNDSLFEKRLPYQFYVVHKHNEEYTTPLGIHMKDKQITTFGVHVEPQITEYLSLDFEGAKQFGTMGRGKRQAGGYMGYGAIEFHPSLVKDVKTYAWLSAKYLSGDRHHGGEYDNDIGWDPMWARAPCDSELMQYGTLYGLGYWSNILYTRLTLGAEFSPRHRFQMYSGPMWAAERDGHGHTDGGGSSFKGFLTAARYDFPILIAPKNASGLRRFEIFGHVVGELFNPGDYYESHRPSYFIRWEFIVKF